MTGSVKVTATGPREIRIERDFDAPPANVFRAHTDPALVRRWLTGPAGWSMAQCEIDLRVGGAQRFVLQHRDGREMGWGGTFQQIVPGELLEHTELFDEDWTGGETLVRMEFQRNGNRTRLVQTMRLASEAARDGVLRSGMESGMEASYGLLDQVLGELHPATRQSQAAPA